MGLSVDPPEPPVLKSQIDPDEYDDTEVIGEEYRRDELHEFLVAGAWEQAFEQWTTDTPMDEEEFEIATDLDLFSRFDFFWDAFADRVGYHAPGIPEDWREREIHPDLDSWGTVSAINAGLTELGQIICDVLKDEYIDWETEYEPPEDLPDF
ncbi:hypothetical protein [Halocatena marina]|uniref:hypothetical protein n=1 Tax=Halocatena marina TaxID=2934937 RepID=UPI0022241C0B|nr:hypothetical protein [Halocatena marina]